MSRHLDPERCPTCQGRGSRIYGNGATWHGGMGTASMQQDVCDVCWGTGDADCPGTNARQLIAEANARNVVNAGEWLASQLCLRYEAVQERLPALAEKLRKVRVPGFWHGQDMDRLAAVLEKLAGEKQ